MISRHLAISPHFSPERLLDAVLTTRRQVLLFGAPGVGKSTLAAALARALWRAGRTCTCISADLGSPAFGVPGAVCAGRWHGEGWETLDIEAVCSLDAARFRLPVVSALRRVAARTPSETLLIDAPGVVRGVAGAELLAGMAEAASIDAILLLVSERARMPLREELRALPVEVFPVRAAPGARCPGKTARARNRTRLWNAYLSDAGEGHLALVTSPSWGHPRRSMRARPGRAVRSRYSTSRAVHSP